MLILRHCHKQNAKQWVSPSRRTNSCLLLVSWKMVGWHWQRTIDIDREPVTMMVRQEWVWQYLLPASFFAGFGFCFIRQVDSKYHCDSLILSPPVDLVHGIKIYIDILNNKFQKWTEANNLGHNLARNCFSYASRRQYPCMTTILLTVGILAPDWPLKKIENKEIWFFNIYSLKMTYSSISEAIFLIGYFFYYPMLQNGNLDITSDVWTTVINIGVVFFMWSCLYWILS